VNLNSSLIGGIPQTQEVTNPCARNKIFPEIHLVEAKDINEVWKKVLAKEARYRSVMDAPTI
jgi:alcohol dehydrogenase (NADP+)